MHTLNKMEAMTLLVQTRISFVWAFLVVCRIIRYLIYEELFLFLWYLKWSSVINWIYLTQHLVLSWTKRPKLCNLLWLFFTTIYLSQSAACVYIFFFDYLIRPLASIHSWSLKIKQLHNRNRNLEFRNVIKIAIIE